MYPLTAGPTTEGVLHLPGPSRVEATTWLFPRPAAALQNAHVAVPWTRIRVLGPSESAKRGWSVISSAGPQVGPGSAGAPRPGLGEELTVGDLVGPGEALGGVESCVDLEAGGSAASSPDVEVEHPAAHVVSMASRAISTAGLTAAEEGRIDFARMPVPTFHRACSVFLSRCPRSPDRPGKSQWNAIKLSHAVAFVLSAYVAFSASSTFPATAHWSHEHPHRRAGPPRPPVLRRSSAAPPDAPPAAPATPSLADLNRQWHKDRATARGGDQPWSTGRQDQRQPGRSWGGIGGDGGVGQ